MAKHKHTHQTPSKLKHAGTHLSLVMGQTDISSLSSLRFRPLLRIYTLIHNICWAHKPAKLPLKLSIIMGNAGEAKSTLRPYQHLRKVPTIEPAARTQKIGGKMTARIPRLLPLFQVPNWKPQLYENPTVRKAIQLVNQWGRRKKLRHPSQSML